MEDRVLKTTSKFIAVLAAAVCLLPTCGWADVQSALPFVLSAASLGDDGHSSTTQADALLREARSAMADGNYEIADSKIARAEALQPKYPLLHMGDTPKKARADLDRLQAEKAGGASGSAQKSAAKNPSTAAAKDPFLAQSITNGGAGTQKASANSTGTANTNGTSPTNYGANVANSPGVNDKLSKTVNTPMPAVSLTPAQSAVGQNPQTQATNRDASTARQGNLPAMLPPVRQGAGQSATDLSQPGVMGDKFAAASNNPINGFGSGPQGNNLTGSGLHMPADVIGLAPKTEIPGGTATAKGLEYSSPDAPLETSDGNLLGADKQAKLSKSTDVSPIATQPGLENPAVQNLTSAGIAAARVQKDPAVKSQNMAKAQSDALLLEARRALAHDDVRTAQIKIDQAQGLGIGYSALDDSPAKIESLIIKFKKLPANITINDPETTRRLRAELLMEQAEGLLRWHDYNEAQRLGSEVQRLAINYTPFEPKPDQLLERIAIARTAAAAGLQEGMPLSSIPATLPANLATAAIDSVSAVAKQRAIDMAKQARALIAQGDLATAELIAQQAESLVPDSAFAANEDRPTLVLLDVERAKRNANPPAGNNPRGIGGVIQAGAYEVTPAGGAPASTDSRYSNVQAIYNPQQDSTYNAAATASANLPAGNPVVMAASATTPSSLPAPMIKSDPATASGPVSPISLAPRSMLASTSTSPANGLPPGPLDGVTPSSAALSRQVAAEVTRQQGVARDMREKQPKQALELLQHTRDMVASVNGIDAPAKEQMLRRLDLSIHDLQQYIAANAPEIEQEEKNRQVQQDVDRTRKEKLETEEKVAALVKDFNKLLDEQRYAEAQVVAKRAAELDPENPVVVQLQIMSKMAARVASNQDVKDAQEEGFWATMQEVDKSAVPFSGDFQMPDKKKWNDLTNSRAKQLREGHHRTAKEQEIEQRLSTPVALKFNKTPLSEVAEYLGKIAQVPVFLDPQGLQAEGVQSDTPISIDLSQDISLKSALKLILEPLRLTYVISDEVLKITSIDVKRGQLYTQTYAVGDLVIRIPNFAPTGQEGINGAFREAMARMGWGGAAGGSFGASAPALAVNEPAGNSNMNPAVLAQMNTRGLPIPISGSGQTQSGSGQNIPFGPGGMKGGSQADFDTLIDLITSTIAPSSWSEMGGPGTITGYDTNLSLVVSQTQEVHEQIADLLSQLRKLEDLQVTIEVRFITLEDDFFERIGVDFQFNIPTNTTVPNPPPIAGPPPSFGPVSPSAVVGLDPAGAVTALQDIQFRQGSFTSAIPQFGGFDAGSAATFGFAILSDIQAFFVVQAAQGDNRSNVLQAPKVTLFNGQQATVSDTTQVPFVTSVIPVVGDFAAAQQPVIVVLSEGTSLTVQAVVSNDRRFVRLTVVPFFSNIGAVNTFTFTGSTSSTTKSSESTDNTQQSTSTSNENDASNTATTVQLPQFSFVTVTTTVSVPDGGTVLLGGIKRLSEARIEEGVPVLSKLPYINRLFRNTGIGRTTNSLMMMVTPRIIIQEEEEENLIGPPSP